jgi:branched-chain amino acid transport system permease protein
MFQVLSNALCSGMLLAIGAVGFGLVYFTTRHFHIAHGAIFTVGAYVTLYFSYKFGFSTPLLFIAALTATCLSGMLVERFLYSPLVKRGASNETVLLSSLGLYIVVANFIAIIAGDENITIRQEIRDPFQLFGVTLTSIQILQALTAIVIIISLVALLRFSRIGLALRAVTEDPELSVAHGLDLGRIRVLVLGSGSLLAGLAGCLAALDTGVAPHIGLRAMLEASVCCLAVGSKSVLIQATAAIALVLMQGLIGWGFGVRWSSAATFFIVVVLLVWRAISHPRYRDGS